MGIARVVTRGFLFAKKYVVTAGYTPAAASATAIRDVIGIGVIPFRR